MSIGSERDVAGLKAAGKIVARVIRSMKAAVAPDVTTAALDKIAEQEFQKSGAISSPRKVYDFPGNTCISVNDEVVHGIPGGRVLQGGDLVKIDVTAEKDGYVADACVSVVVGRGHPAARRLIACAERAFRKAARVARSGNRLYDIGRAVELEVRSSGFAVVRELCGHGVGLTIHEEPQVLNYYDPMAAQELTDGLVITVEPIITAGSGRVFTADDGWTVRTRDGSLAAHYEHTMIITRDKPILLTA